MKCKHCNSEWNTSEELGSKLSSCPFCGKELIPEPAPASKATSIQEVLQEIIRLHGIEAMEKGNRMISFYMDMAPAPLRKEKTILDYLVRCNGNELLLEVKDQPLSQRQVRYEQVVDKLCSELYISEAAARKVCNAFCIAVYGESVEKPRQEQSSKPKEKEPAKKQTPPKNTEQQTNAAGSAASQKKPVDKASLDIKTTLYLSEAEAAAGCLKKISLPDGLPSVSVKVPAGTLSGATLRLKECGRRDPNAQWGMPCQKGDVYLAVSVIPDPPKKKAKKQPPTLHCNLTITPEEALKGCQKVVDFAGIDKVPVTLPPQTPEGFVIKLPHCGTKDPETGEKGLLILTVKLEQPKVTRSYKAGSKAEKSVKESDVAVKDTNYVFYITPEQAEKGDSYMVKGIYGMRVTIPAGTKDGQTVRVKGQGREYTAKAKVSTGVYSLRPQESDWSGMSEQLLEAHMTKKAMSNGAAIGWCILLFFASAFLGTVSPILGFGGWFYAFYIPWRASKIRKNRERAEITDTVRRKSAKEAFSDK